MRISHLFRAHHLGLGLLLWLGLAEPSAAGSELELRAGSSRLIAVSATQPARLLVASPPPAGGAWLLTLEEIGVDLRVERSSILDTEASSIEVLDAPVRRRGLFSLILSAPGDVLVRPRDDGSEGQVRVELRAVGMGSPIFEGHSAMQAGARQAAEETKEARRLALEAYGRAAEIWRRAGEPAMRAEALESRAVLLRALGEMPDALATLEVLVEVRRGLGEDSRLAIATNTLGLTLRDLGRPREARLTIDEALALFRRLDDASGEASAHNNLCMLDHAAGALREAIPCYGAALEVFRRAEEPGEVATVLNNLGFAWDGLGEPTAARRAYEQALEIRRRLKDRRAEAQQLNNLGAIDRRSGDFASALERYLEALSILEELGDQRRLGSVRNNLGIVYFSLGDLAKARELYEEALALRRQTGDRRGELISLNNLGSVLSLQGAWPEALKAHHQALDIARDLGSTRLEQETLRRLGKGALVAGRPRVALGSLRQTAERLRGSEFRLTTARAEQALGEAWLAVGEAEPSKAALERALAGLRDLGEPVEEATALATLARWEQAHGELDQALARVDQAFERLETVRARLANPRLGAGLLGHSDLWELRIELLMDRHRAEPGKGFDRRAFLAGEEARAQSLRRLRRRSSPDPESSRDRSRQELVQRFAAKADRLLRLADRAGNGARSEELEKELVALGAELDRLESGRAGEGAPLPAFEDLSSLTALLGPETALVSYALGRSSSYVFRLSGGELTSFALPGRGEIEQLALRVYADLSTLGTGHVEEAARNRALAEKLLGQVLEGLENTERLAIVADGALHYLPFAALLDPLHPGDPLVERFEVVSLPSASVLALQRTGRASMRAAEGAPEIVILADPVFQADDRRLETRGPRQAAPVPGSPGAASLSGSGAAFERLPATRREAEAIAELLPGGGSLLAFGTEATREKLLGPEVAGARFVHLATHGLYDARRPWLSGLTFSRFDANGDPQAGFVSLRDLEPLRLQAELVTLSACSSALGRQVRGEGLFGLTHGLLRAGAGRVLSSLWQVRDRGTAELMVLFYRAIWHEGAGAGEALRRAQRELRSSPRYRDPYYWSPFVLQGDWRPPG